MGPLSPDCGFEVSLAVLSSAEFRGQLLCYSPCIARHEVDASSGWPRDLADGVQHTFIHGVQLADDIRLFGYFNNQSLQGCPESSDTGSSFMRYLQFDPKREENDQK